jgi:hypothetical protein
MTPREQRIAIAVACGWTDCEYIESLGLCKGKHENSHVQYDSGHSSLPDYLNDLNAMHEVEKTLTDDRIITKPFGTTTSERKRFRRYLAEIGFREEHQREHDGNEDADGPWTCDQLVGYTIHATAAQRAEAYLKVKGLWYETIQT